MNELSQKILLLIQLSHALSTFFHMIVNKIMAVNSLNPTERVGLLIVKLESFRGIIIGCYKNKIPKKRLWKSI